MIKALGIATVTAALAALALPAAAREPHGHAGGAGDAHAAVTASVTAGESVTGEVRRVDRDRQRITLRHGEIMNLGMPPMTMVFRVRDPAWLDQMRVGDKVSFRVESIDGVHTITELRPVQ